MKRRAPAPLAGARSFACLAFADELTDAPELLAAYADAFSGRDDATLVIYAPDWSGEEVGARLGRAVAAAGLETDDGADLLAHAGARDPRVERLLGAGVEAVFSRRPPHGSFARCAHLDERRLGELRALAERCWAARGAAAGAGSVAGSAVGSVAGSAG